MEILHENWTVNFHFTDRFWNPYGIMEFINGAQPRFQILRKSKGAKIKYCDWLPLGMAKKYWGAYSRKLKSHISHLFYILYKINSHIVSGT